MPRLRNKVQIVDLANSRLSNNMKQRLYELNGSSVINLLNIAILYIRFGPGTRFEFGYEENVLYRYIDMEIEHPVVMYEDEEADHGGISWHLVTDIELEDDMVVFYQR